MAATHTVPLVWARSDTAFSIRASQARWQAGYTYASRRLHVSKLYEGLDSSPADHDDLQDLAVGGTDRVEHTARDRVPGKNICAKRACSVPSDKEKEVTHFQCVPAATQAQLIASDQNDVDGWATAKLYTHSFDTADTNLPQTTRELKRELDLSGRAQGQP